MKDQSLIQRYQLRKLKYWRKKVLPKSKFLLNSDSENVFTKTDMMNHFDDWVTCGISKQDAFEVALKAESSRDFSPTIGEVTIGLSSGTSGHRGVFLANPRERDLWSGVILAKVLPRPIWQKHKVAFFLRANSNLYETVKSRNIQFEYFDLMDNLEDQMLRMNHFQPTLLVAPAQVLVAMTQFEFEFQVEKVVSVAEVLQKDDKALLEGFFGQIIHEVYQCTEGLLATTCEKGTLHLNEEYVHFEKEFIDDQKQYFNPVISDFSRVTQPIYRYRMNDVLKLGQCDCSRSSTAIESIEGRLDDVLYGQVQGRYQAFFPDVIRHQILQVDLTVKDYQFVQIDQDLFSLRTLPELGEVDQKSFNNHWNQFWPQVCQIQFEKMETSNAMTKKRRVLSLWRPSELG